MKNKEIGGYIELDTYNGTEYHDQTVPLNCGRACMEYLIKQKNIKKVHLPYFMCSSVLAVCEKLNIDYEYYNIDTELRPKAEQKFEGKEWIYIVNYYGLLSDDETIQFKEKYGNIIIDNTQAFFNCLLQVLTRCIHAGSFSGSLTARICIPTRNR